MIMPMCPKTPILPLGLLDQLPLREPLCAPSILGNDICDSFGIRNPRTDITVIGQVSRLVVVHIIWLASLTSKHCDLLWGLDAFRTSKKTAARDVDLKEWAVVGTAGEGGGDELQAGTFVVVLKGILNQVGPCGAGEVKTGSVTIVDAVDIVWGSTVGSF